MTGWSPLRRTPREYRPGPFRGYKLACPVVCADGAQAGFTGVNLGRARAYGRSAEAVCAQNGRHHCPGRWCDCGFYCFHAFDDARALACDSQYRGSVLLQVEASGRYIRYEKGLRYSQQEIMTVWVGPCGCGGPAEALADTGTGIVGWRRLAAVCLICAGGRQAWSLDGFARLAGGVQIERDERLAGTSTDGAAVAEKTELVPFLSAEMALLHARLDELQAQLDRLNGER